MTTVVLPQDAGLLEPLGDGTTQLRVVDEAGVGPLYRTWTGKGRRQQVRLEGVAEVGGWSVLGLPMLRVPAPPLKTAPWQVLAVVVAALPLLVTGLILFSDVVIFGGRVVIFGVGSSVGCYVGIVRLSQMRRRERPQVAPTHSGVVGIMISSEQLILRYPDRAFAVPWSAVVGARVVAAADGLGAGEHTQIAQQMQLELRREGARETVAVHELFEASDAQLDPAQRDALGVLMAAADWITERAQSGGPRR